MLAIAAAAAFVGLFALWVLAPRFLIRRKHNETDAPLSTLYEETAPEPAPAD